MLVLPFNGEYMKSIFGNLFCKHEYEYLYSTNVYYTARPYNKFSHVEHTYRCSKCNKNKNSKKELSS